VSETNPLPRVFRWLLTREAAQGCVVWINVFNWSTGERIMEPIPGRWSKSSQPLRSIPSPPPQPVGSGAGTAIIDPSYRPFSEAFDPTLIQREQDVPVTEGGEEVSVAILRAGEAFVFTDSSYAYPAWGHPDLELKRGTYRIVVRARASSVVCEQAFKLEYLSDDFARFQLSTA
jgi:hypothetical protein